MVAIINILAVVGAVLFLFGTVICAHEFGRFWVARICGLKIEAFAIGLGPRILSWTRKGIEYSVRWMPVGVFVKIPQMATSEALEGKADASDPIPPTSTWSKILVAFAGPFTNVVFAFLIACVIYAVGLPVPVNPREIGRVPPDSDEARLGIRPGDVIVAVDGKKVGNGQEIFSAAVFARTNVVPVVIERNGLRKTYNLKLNATNNALGLKMLNLDLKDYVMIGNVEPNSPAAKAQLKPNDVILSFAGVPIYSIEQLMELVSKRPLQPSEILVERGRSKLTLIVTPRPDPERALGLRIVDGKGYLQIASVDTNTNAPAAKAKLMSKDVIVSFAGVPINSREKLAEVVYKRAEQPSEIVVERGQSELSSRSSERRFGFRLLYHEGRRIEPASQIVVEGGQSKLSLNVTPRVGARIGISFATRYIIQKPGPTPWTKIAGVWNTTISTITAQFQLRSRPTDASVKDLSGPPGILMMLAAQFHSDYRLALNFLFLLNINFALILLLPVPALDGGHIVRAIVERIPISPETGEWITSAFAVLLISLMLFVGLIGCN